MENQLIKVLSRADMIDLFVETKELILSGKENPIKIAVSLKVFEELIKKLRTDMNINECILEEAIKEDAKTFKMYGAEIQIKEMGTKYDFSDCNDGLLEDLYKQMNALKERIRMRELMLKSISEDSPAVSMEGEILNPPLKTSKTGISITLK